MFWHHLASELLHEGGAHAPAGHVEDRVIVDGINLVKKHAKGNPQMGDPGGIQEKELSIHISNVALFNPSSKKGERIGFRTNDEGQKERFFRSDSSSVDS